MPIERPAKLAIVGAGSTGTALAYAALIRGIARHIALYDVNKNKVQAESLDLNQGMQFAPPARVDGSDDISVCANADVVVIAAGAKQKMGQTRTDLAANNLQILRRLIPELMKAAPEAVLLVASSPVDWLTHVALKLSGLPKNRVLGIGTALDSSRFRFLIAQRCKVSVQNVHAFIAGEQGENEIPLWSSASIANIALHEWSISDHGRLTEQDRADIFEAGKTAAREIIQVKGGAPFAVGLATASIIQAILNDEHRVLSVCSELNEYRGINDVCLSVPSIVNRNGVEIALPIPMNPAEVSALQSSAATVAESLKALGF